MGSMGASYFVNTWTGPLKSAGFSHGSINTTRLYYEDDYNPAPLDEWQGRLRHNLGGSPEDAYDRYRDASLELSVLEGTLELPLFHLWSDLDPVSIAAAHQDMPAAFAGYSAPWGDYNSGVQGHSVTHNLDFPFATTALTRFLDGLAVQIMEGEDGAGRVGQSVWDDEIWAMASGTGVRASDRAGVLYRQTIAADGAVRATFFLFGDPEVTATLRLLDASGGVLSETSVRGDALQRGDRDYPTLREVLAETTLTASSSGEVILEVESDGAGALALDVVIVD